MAVGTMAQSAPDVLNGTRCALSRSIREPLISDLIVGGMATKVSAPRRLGVSSKSPGGLAPTRAGTHHPSRKEFR